MEALLLPPRFHTPDLSGAPTIRLARPSDLPALPEIERAAAALFRDRGLHELFSTVLTDAGDLARACAEGRLWVAVCASGAPVGFAVGSLVGDNAHLDELDVHPDQGRRGIGRALVEAVIAWARATGRPALTLTTLRDVPWNAPFYERMGFRILEAGERGAVLDEILREEVERGLPAEGRVAMRLLL